MLNLSAVYEVAASQAPISELESSHEQQIPELGGASVCRPCAAFDRCRPGPRAAGRELQWCHQLHRPDQRLFTRERQRWTMGNAWSMVIGPSTMVGCRRFFRRYDLSDYGTTAGVLDATKGGQSAHTHHIKLTNAAVIWNMDGCPTFSPATTMGFQFSGTVSLITGNGGPAPFETDPPSSTLQVCVTGGADVSYSNITLVFGGPATTHFGPQAIDGVVRNASADPFGRD